MKIAGNRLADIDRYFKSALAERYTPSEILVLYRMAAQHISGFSGIKLHLEPETRVNQSELLQYSFFVKRLKQGEPVQYIMGYTWFMDLKLEVDAQVLIPRPETEELVNLVLEYLNGKPQPKVVDACSGSGCIALALKYYRNDAAVSGLELMLGARDVAVRNAISLQLDVPFTLLDVLAASNADFPAELDVLVSNPPYIPNAEQRNMSDTVTAFEPHIALFVPDSDPLLFYRSLAERAQSVLKSRGLLAFECHERLTEAIQKHLEESGFLQVSVLQDLSGKPRFVTALKP